MKKPHNPRLAAIHSLKSFLHKSEAGRFAPKESAEPKMEEAHEPAGHSEEELEALKSLLHEKE